MNYPVWTVPFLGTTWIIGLVACIHIFISHFAVGGGMFFAVTEWWAYKTGDDRIYDYLKKHSQFFLILTTVAGVVTGVGIWWAIGLVNPSGTHTLIQIFTLGWAEEYLFFAAELATIFVYYYTWNRIPREQHLSLAIWYAIMSVFTLIIINGIITFMLTPGNWLESRYWLEGFFNETYWPSLFLRLLIMAALAGMYALLTASLIKSDLDFRAKMLKYASKWFIPIFILGPIIGYWYFTNLPADAVENIMTGIQSSGIGNFSVLARAIYLSMILSGTILVFVFVGPYLNPKGFSFNAALLFMVCGLVVTGIGEWSREMLRKPYVVYDYMYSNGILKDDAAKLNAQGTAFAMVAKWTPEGASTQRLGKDMFKYQCMSCHTQNGYRGIKRLLGERDEEAIVSFLQLLQESDPDKNPYHGIMPPLVGTDAEVAALAKYLATLKENEPATQHVAATTSGEPRTSLE
ncbi:MAG: cytochrome ubiquinol oxidase subunit I [Vampirovibrio sp.]|nr:cytochrome ubiquinol oxidase subunit I [Vampirovibrio sp.]